MKQPLALTAWTLVSALGRGLEPTLDALRAERSGLRPCDLPGVSLNTWIGRVEGLEDEPLRGDILQRYDCRNNRLAALCLQQDGFEEAVIAARTRYGADRVAVILGTSTSGIANTEAAYAARDSDTGALSEDYVRRYRYTHNTFSLADFVSTYFGLTGPAVVISTACSSSAKVFASASRYLASGLCDAAIVGGVDTLCLTTLYGFSALQLTSSLPCRPCDARRDGLSLGEAGAFLLLEREGRADALRLLGYGESNDGYHMSHPHPQGAGASAAMRAALFRASMSAAEIDYVNLHGTATPANDRVEDQAVTAVFGTGVPCSSTKGWTGHTLGAAGATAAVIAALTIRHHFLPGTVNTQCIDPDLQAQILLHNRPASVRTVLMNIFGFGGNNCCLVIGVGTSA